MNTGPPELWGSIPDGSLSRRLIAQHDGADGGGMPLGSAMSGSDLAGIEIPGDLRPAGTGLVGCHDLSDNLRVQFGPATETHTLGALDRKCIFGPLADDASLPLSSRGHAFAMNSPAGVLRSMPKSSATRFHF